MFRRHHKALRDWKSALLLFALALVQSLTILRAQSVMVNVTPVQPILPPQVLLYVSDPGKFFNIQLSNNSGTAVPVHLQLEIEHVNPALGLKIITPTHVQPPKPFVVPANGTYQLNQIEMNGLFDHIPSDMIQAPQGLFDDITDGTFGLLPEGQYRARVVAYKWADPQYEVPVVASNPASGTCLFTVCYKAQAPEFIPKEPIFGAIGNKQYRAGENVQFNWTIPTINCGASTTYNYDFRVVEVLPGQQPDDAMRRNPIVYQVKKLVAPTCIIPTDVVRRLFLPDKNYICQVTANPNATTVLNYVMLNNGGESDYRMFHIAADPGVDKVDETAGAVEEVEPVDLEIDTTAPIIDEEEPDDEDDDWDGDFIWLGSEVTDSISTDALYTFRNPTITLPTFDEYGARRKYIGDDINVAWNSVFFLGGEGEHPENLTFQYEVKLYKGADQTADRESTLKTTPILSKTITNEDDLTTVFTWTELADKVEDRDYLVLQIVPTCTNEESIAYYDDELNIIDFAIVKHLYTSFFECSNQLTIENTTPTTKSVEELKGTTVTIGEYELTLDSRDLTKNQDGTYKGRGKIKWEPLGTNVNVCVKFDTLRINTDDIVYGGLCYTYAKDNTLSDAEVAEKLFTDWGIDNFIGDSGIPYADRISDEAKAKAKSLAAEIDLAKYYKYVQTGQATYEFLGTGNIEELYLPCDLPEAFNSSPVKIQISTMKFAPTHATMDLIGEFALPNSNYLKNDILVFGAPRLCISPNEVIPEAGTIALLKDFGITDPKSTYEMNFKAPEDIMKPTDGCYIAWKDHKFEVLGVDVDMKIPHLLKDKNGEATTEKPTLNIRAMIADWDNWMVDRINMEAFQVEDLPGWTFEASNIVYDHSLFQNSANMGKFPAKYDKEKAGITGIVKSKGETYSVENDVDWQGLFIEKIDVLFPKSFEIGGETDKRFRATVSNMFFDKSGATMSAGFKDVFSAHNGKDGKIGGWSFSIDDISLNFIQSNFDNCHFGGKIGVPLLKKSSNEDEYAKLGYDCQIRKALRDGKEIDNTAYIFTIQQIDDEMTLDFLIAKAKFDKKLTYFAVEAESGTNAADTHVELMMGGNMTIGGTDWLESKLKINLPDIHFSGLRIANCDPTWRSQYDHLKKMQDDANNDNTRLLLKLYEGSTFNNDAKTFYFSTGAWSLASLEKSIGPFTFTLDKYSIGQDKDPLPEGKKGGDMNLKLAIGGKVALVKGIDISASAYVSLRFSISGVKDIGNIGASFNGCTLDSLGVHTAFCGITIDGKMAQEDDDTRTGFKGTLGVKMPGGIFDMEMEGGYYEEKAKGTTSAFTWGFFTLSLGGKSGIPIPPVQLNKITGGFYFNCKPGKEGGAATPQEGEIGIVLGLGLSTVGSDDVLKGDFTMTVIYDKKRNNGAGGLTQFLFLGNVDAVDGLIKANIKLIYESTDTDEYFQLTLSADSSLDNVEAIKAFNGQMEELYENLTPNGEAGLKELEEEQSKNSKNKSGKDGSPEKGGSTSVAKVKVTLDVKITKMANGKKLDKVKWHVYLGEPERDKRCSLTLIDFKSPVVTVYIGANAYVCVGNELPNDGQLPPIPTNIAKFLNGSENGVTKNDGIDQANSARAQAMANFGGTVVGGVMFGAEVYGGLDVNLGILKAGIHADAGFDISLRKLQGAVCTNTNGHPGWNQWYGEGQLYAYLKAYLDLIINLGFYKKDLTIADTEIGGVLHMGGPNPTFFDGKLRAKINLLGGLINFDKKFEFECGEKCDLFMGNPLDNFMLFDYCSIGDTVVDRSWSKANAISPYLRHPPYINTNADIDQHFRVLDETEYAKITKNYNGNIEDLKIEAERTFIFRRTNVAYLFEYSDDRQYTHSVWQKARREGRDHFERTRSDGHRINMIDERHHNRNDNNYDKYYEINLNSTNPRHHMIDMAQLRKYMKPNRFYRLEFNGRAFEIERGKEVDPVTFDTIQSKYSHRPWIQSYDVFFCTAGETAYADTCKLEDFVALAYPSYGHALHDGVKDSEVGDYKPVYANDAKAPTIALTKDISKTAYRKGKLYWRWLNTKGYEIHREENAWVVRDSMCNMEPQRPCSTLSDNGRYILSLDYVTFSKEGGKVVADTLNLARLHMDLFPTNWRTGHNSKCLPYERPFKAVRLIDYKYTDYSGQVTDKSDIALGFVQQRINGKMARYHNPFLFIPYLSDFAFIGGWDVDANYYRMHVTTSQSVLMRMQGAGVYEGSFGSRNGVKAAYYDNQSANIWADQEVVRNMFFYDEKQYRSTYGSWPLPKPATAEDEYVLNYDERTYPFTTAPEGSPLVHLSACRSDVVNRYKWVKDFDTKIRQEMRRFLDDIDLWKRQHFPNGNVVGMRDAIGLWINRYRGTYIGAGSSAYGGSESSSYVKGEDANRYFLSMPFYQIPFTMGSEYSEPLYYVFQDMMHKEHYRAFGDVMAYTSRNFMGASASGNTRDTYYYDDDAKQYAKVLGISRPSTTLDNYNEEEARKEITQARFYVYRVNGYNFSTGNYVVRNDLLNGAGAFMMTVNNPYTDSPSLSSSVTYSGWNTTGTSKGVVTGQSSVGGSTAVGNEGQYNDLINQLVGVKAQMAEYASSSTGYVVSANRNKVLSEMRTEAEEMKKRVSRIVAFLGTSTYDTEYDKLVSSFNKVAGYYGTIDNAYKTVKSNNTNAATYLSTAAGYIKSLRSSLAANSATLAASEGDYTACQGFRESCSTDYAAYTTYYNEADSLYKACMDMKEGLSEANAAAFAAAYKANVGELYSKVQTFNTTYDSYKRSTGEYDYSAITLNKKHLDSLSRAAQMYVKTGEERYRNGISYTLMGYQEYYRRIFKNKKVVEDNYNNVVKPYADSLSSYRDRIDYLYPSLIAQGWTYKNDYSFTKNYNKYGENCIGFDNTQADLKRIHSELEDICRAADDTLRKYLNTISDDEIRELFEAAKHYSDLANEVVENIRQLNNQLLSSSGKTAEDFKTMTDYIHDIIIKYDHYCSSALEHSTLSQDYREEAYDLALEYCQLINGYSDILNRCKDYQADYQEAYALYKDKYDRLMLNKYLPTDVKNNLPVLDDMTKIAPIYVLFTKYADICKEQITKLPSQHEQLYDIVVTLWDNYAKIISIQDDFNATSQSIVDAIDKMEDYQDKIISGVLDINEPSTIKLLDDHIEKTQSAIDRMKQLSTRRNELYEHYRHFSDNYNIQRLSDTYLKHPADSRKQQDIEKILEQRAVFYSQYKDVDNDYYIARAEENLEIIKSLKSSILAFDNAEALALERQIVELENRFNQLSPQFKAIFDDAKRYEKYVKTIGFEMDFNTKVWFYNKNYTTIEVVEDVFFKAKESMEYRKNFVKRIDMEKWNEYYQLLNDIHHKYAELLELIPHHTDRHNEITNKEYRFGDLSEDATRIQTGFIDFVNDEENILRTIEEIHQETLERFNSNR